MNTTARMALLLVLLSFANPLVGQEPVGPHGEAGLVALQAGRWAEAESHFTAGYEVADAGTRGAFAFFRGFAAFRQGEEVARSNSAGHPEVARSALSHFERALPLVLESDREDTGVLARAVQQYIDNQRMIIIAREREPQ
jgi:hypothetical protein